MDLIFTLYALLVLQLEPDPIPDAYKQLKSKALPYYFELVEGLEGAVQSFLRGEEDYGELPAGLRAFIKEYERQPTAKPTTVALLKGFVSWMLTGNENVFKRLSAAAAGEQYPTWISNNLSTTMVDQAPVNKRLRELITKMTRGKYEGTGFASIDDAKEAKGKFPKIYEEFMALRKQHVQSWKASMAQFVKDSGEKTVPCQDLLKFFAKNKIECGFPKGFTGNVDGVGKWYTRFGELINGVPAATLFPAVRMNAAYTKGSTEYVFVGIRQNGTEGNYFYTTATKKSNTLQKFAKVEDFSHIIKSVRGKWMQHILKGDPADKKTVSCVILELIYQFSARIGSRPAEHNGISSLTLANYTETDSGFILKYLGKDKVPTRHVLKATDPLTKRIASIVKLLASHPMKKRKDFLFTYNLKTGNFKLVQAGEVTRMFRECGAGPLSVHKLRTSHATELMKKEIEKVYSVRTKFKNTNDALVLLKKLAMKVGKDLNHVRRNALGETTVTSNTALANYIDISLQVSFFQHYGLPVPKYLEAFVDHPEKLMAFSYVTSEDGGEPKEQDLQEDTQQSEDANDQRESDLKKSMDAEDEELNRRLEKDAERIGRMLTQGGRGAGNMPSGAEGFDNQLV